MRAITGWHLWYIRRGGKELRHGWEIREKKEERPREYIHTRMDVHEDERGNKGKVKKIESPISAPTKNRVDT